MNSEEVLNHKDPPDGIVDKVINAAIVAGFAFFSTLAGVGASGVTKDPVQCLVAGGISAGVSFFGSLALQLGLIRQKVG